MELGVVSGMEDVSYTGANQLNLDRNSVYSHDPSSILNVTWL